MATENTDLKKKAAAILGALKKEHPDARLFLDFDSPFQLLIVTILAAQARDEVINEVRPALFDRYPDAGALAKARDSTLQTLVKRSGTFRRKAKSIKAVSKELIDKFGGEVPDNMDDLVNLPGVGRKTAAIVLGNAFGKPAIAVDTHVQRVSARLGLAGAKKPDDIEKELCAIIQRKRWTEATKILGTHGRRICIARKPLCTLCPVSEWCNYYAENRPDGSLFA